MGPAGIALVATASLANQAIKLRKEYKKQKEEMAKKGKILKVKSFLKDNKMALAGAALTALGAATAGLAAVEMPQAIVQSLQQAKATSGIALGAASSIKAFRDTRKNGGSVLKSLGSASFAAASTAWAIIAGQNQHDANVEVPNNPEVSTPVVEEPQPMLDRDNDGISDYIDRDGGEGWANTPEKEVEPPVQQEPEVKREPEAPIVQQEPEVKQEPVVEKAPEMPEALRQPLEKPSLASMVQQEDHRMVIDPHSHKLVEFSLDEQGNVHTHSADIVGSKELHDAVVTNVLSDTKDGGILDNNEVAFVEKHTSQETAEVLLDRNNQRIEAQQGVPGATLELPQTSLTDALPPEEKNPTLSAHEKLTALRGGQTVDDATNAKASVGQPKIMAENITKTPTIPNMPRNNGGYGMA